MVAVGISCDHLVKLYQFLEDFANASGGSRRRKAPLSGNREPNSAHEFPLKAAIWQNL
jgi:hypothetical protein